MRLIVSACLAAAVVLLAAEARAPEAPPEPPPSAGVEYGKASFYARMLDGRRTASGVRFDNDALVAAHPRHVFGTRLRVTNLENKRSVIVTIVDRGPSRGPRRNGVIIDLSRAAARRLDFLDDGHARVKVERVRPR